MAWGGALGGRTNPNEDAEKEAEAPLQTSCSPEDVADVILGLTGKHAPSTKRLNQFKDDEEKSFEPEAAVAQDTSRSL